MSTTVTHPPAPLVTRTYPAAQLRAAADRLEAAVNAVGTDRSDWYTGDPGIDFGDEQVPAADCRLIALMSPAAVSRLIPLLRRAAERADRMGDVYWASEDLELIEFAALVIAGDFGTGKPATGAAS